MFVEDMSINNCSHVRISLVLRFISFSEQFTDCPSWMEDCCGTVVVSCCCEKLVADYGTVREPRRENLRCWEPLPSNSSKDVTADTGVCNSEL
jgi:hypothetical protein